MCGYTSYQDPRLACPPEEPEEEQERRCGNCGHYTECERSQNGLKELIGVYYAEPDETPESVDCDWWVER